MRKHSFKKSGTNFYKNGAGGGSKAIYKIYKKNRRFGNGCGPLHLWQLRTRILTIALWPVNTSDGDSIRNSCDVLETPCTLILNNLLDIKLWEQYLPNFYLIF